MSEIKTVCTDRIMIQSALPIKTLLGMEITQKMNEHGSVWIKIVVPDEVQEAFMDYPCQGEKIEVFDVYNEKSTLPLFCGKIQKAVCYMENRILTTEIYAVSYSIELDLEKKCRSFQNPEVRYEELVKEVTKGSKARFLWRVEANKRTETPLIQYQETDWDFLKRLASQFWSSLIVSFTSERPDFYFGMNEGEERVINELDILEKGFSSTYYENGGYAEKQPRRKYLYLQVKHKQEWQMGDFVWYRKNRFTVYKRCIQFEKGELYFIDTMGTEGMLETKTQYNAALKGLKLQGTIRKAEKESVFIQLNFDSKEQADYAWPWVPEVGNLCYCMPEVGSKTVLSLPTENEKDGIAVQLLRTNKNSSLYQNVNNREFVTAHNKKLGLYPQQILLEARDGTASLALEDQSGIQWNSVGNIRLQAQGDICLNAESISIKAPQEITLQTEQSNIKICKNFNFYAPNGVKTKGKDSHPMNPKENQKADGVEESNHLQLSYSALGAIPSTDLSKMDNDCIVDIAACGAVPKIAKGSTAVAMSEVMEGKKAEDTSFPQAFSSMGNYTMKGGSFLPLS